MGCGGRQYGHRSRRGLFAHCGSSKYCCHTANHSMVAFTPFSNKAGCEAWFLAEPGRRAHAGQEPKRNDRSHRTPDRTGPGLQPDGGVYRRRYQHRIGHPGFPGTGRRLGKIRPQRFSHRPLPGQRGRAPPLLAAQHGDVPANPDVPAQRRPSGGGHPGTDGQGGGGDHPEYRRTASGCRVVSAKNDRIAWLHPVRELPFV